MSPRKGGASSCRRERTTPHRLNQPTSELDDVGHFDKSSVRTTKAGEVVGTSLPGRAGQVDKAK